MPESSAIRIRPVSEVPVEACLRAQRTRIERLLPGANLVHVGWIGRGRIHEVRKGVRDGRGTSTRCEATRYTREKGDFIER
jgi:hypothetical protein